MPESLIENIINLPHPHILSILSIDVYDNCRRPVQRETIRLNYRLEGTALIPMEYLRKPFKNTDKVTLALLLEEGRAKISELRFHLTITQQQITDALNELRNEGLVKFEIKTESYILV